MSHPWIALAGIVALGALYVLLPVVASAFARYRVPRRLRCPETHETAEVGVDARYAAWTAAFRQPLLRVTRCSRWPERAGCGQGCLAAADAPPERASTTPAELAR